MGRRGPARFRIGCRRLQRAMWVLLAMAPGSAGAGWPCPQSADVDGDKVADRVILSVQQAGVQVGTGLLTVPLAPASVRAICLADLDGNGQADLLTWVVRGASRDRRLRARLFAFAVRDGSAWPMFFGTEGDGDLLALGVADLDADGRAEVLAQEGTVAGNRTRVYRWSGYGLTEAAALLAQAPAFAQDPPAALPERAPLTAAPALPVVFADEELNWERAQGRIRAARVKADLRPAVNRQKLRWLPAAARRSLAANGFAVVRPRDPVAQFHSLYIDNQYRGLPSFVTADAALHLTHQLFDHALQQVEADLLAPILARLVDDLRQRTGDLAGVLPADLEPVRARLALRLDVAHGLLSGAVLAGPAQEIITQLEGAAGPRQNAFGLDHGDYVVRGHYTADPLLARYFRATLFLSQAADASEAEAALLGLLLASDPDCQVLLGRLASFQRALVGPPAGRTSLDLVDPARSALGGQVEFKTLAGPFPWVGDVERAPITLLPRSQTGDNGLLLVGVDPARRPWPDPLDLLASLGSNRARALLEPAVQAWPPLAQRLAEARGAVRAGRVLDTKSVAGRWLAALRWLLLDYPAGYASFQQNQAWQSHTLVSAAAAWAELRRDTILYTQPPVVWMEGGDEDELPPSRAGFVEPLPELYLELAEVLGGMQTALTSLGASTGRALDGRRKPSALEMLDSGAELLRFLADCATKQLSGGGLSRDEHAQLAEIGTRFEHILSGGGTIRAEPVPVVADVYYFGDPASGVKRPLLVATGPVDEVVVAFPLGKRIALARGAVYSFYSFQGQAPLSDQDWRTMLSGGKAPRQPAWARPIPLSARRRPARPPRARH